MPFIGYDSWEEQYFTGVQEYADGVLIPCGDVESYPLYPEYQWVYNKLELCRKQNIQAAPLGVKPPTDKPVFVKPITNLYGLAAGAYRSYDPEYFPGFFWMECLEGLQTSTDVVVLNGEPQWMFTMRPHFNEWGWLWLWSRMETPTDVKTSLRYWLTKYLSDFTGVMNFEMIGDKIIEAPLRMSPQWVDLYGYNWLADVTDLYKFKEWNFDEEEDIYHNAYSYVTRVARHNATLHQIAEPPPLRGGVTSFQLPWKEGDHLFDIHDADDNVRLTVVNGYYKDVVKSFAIQLALTTKVRYE